MLNCHGPYLLLLFYNLVFNMKNKRPNNKVKKKTKVLYPEFDRIFFVAHTVVLLTKLLILI
jgi:hypothetical protein